jgi:hypothetical protein
MEPWAALLLKPPANRTHTTTPHAKGRCFYRIRRTARIGKRSAARKVIKFAFSGRLTGTPMDTSQPINKSTISVNAITLCCSDLEEFFSLMPSSNIHPIPTIIGNTMVQSSKPATIHCITNSTRICRNERHINNTHCVLTSANAAKQPHASTAPIARLITAGLLRLQNLRAPTKKRAI